MKRKFILVICLLVILFSSYGIWRLRLTRGIGIKLETIRDARLPTSIKELNEWYAPVPDSENAALVITQAIALLRNYSDNRSNEIAEFELPSRGQDFTVEQLQLLSGYVEMNSDALTKLHEAIKLPKSRYPGILPYQMPGAWVTELARVAQYRTLLTSNSGLLPGTNILIADILGMVRTLDSAPSEVSQLYRRILVHISTTTLERRLNDAGMTEPELADLASLFSGIEQSNLTMRALVGQRAAAIPYFLFEIEPVIMAAREGVEFDEPLQPRHQSLFDRLTALHERDLRFFLNNMETNIAFAKLPMPRDLDAINDFQKTVNLQRLLKLYGYNMSATFLPHISWALTREAETFAFIRLAISAIAIERFRLANGRPPESLSSLIPQFLPAIPIDPFDGEGLRYRRLAAGYVIYSVDLDCHDDGGRERPDYKKSTDTNSYDITFTVER